MFFLLKNKSNNPIETETVKFKTILTTIQKTSKAMSIHCLLKSKTFYNQANPSQELSKIINSIENTKPIKLVIEINLSKE